MPKPVSSQSHLERLSRDAEEVEDRVHAVLESIRPNVWAPEDQSCEFIGTAMSELLRILAGFEGAMVHRTCRSRGDDLCAWQARSVDVDDPY